MIMIADGSYSIGKLKISPNLVLAPMSGVTSAPFRRLMRILNPGCIGLTISEFISVEGMTRQQRRSLSMMKFYPEERPFGIQIFGYDPIRLRDAALMVQDSGVDLVDINCGCPAPKVVRNGGGCELMRQPEHLTRILREVRAAVSIPLTMKFRSGWDSDSINALEVAKIAEGEGLDAIAVHGRTRAQLYRGEADWEIVSKVVQSVKIPVLGSGDVVSRDSAALKLQSGVAGLLIGRAALYNPYIFREVCEAALPEGAKSEIDAIKIVRTFVELLLQDFAAGHCTGRVKQLVSQMCRGFSWTKPILRAQNLEEQLAVLASVSSPATDWRNCDELRSHASC